MRRIVFTVCAGLAASLMASGALAASLDRVKFLEGSAAAERLTQEELAAEVKGYLPAGALDAGAVLPAPPAVDSAQDKTDVAWLKGANGGAGQARWDKALKDDASLYDRFEPALGLKLDRKNLPRLIRLLNRVAEDVLAAASEAKKRHPRPRPFQRFQLKRVCGQVVPTKPEAAPTAGTSYPSGHAAVSWAAALVMMETRPSEATPLIMRAVEFGHSRVVCGVHFPSDVDAGRLVAVAVIDKLFATPAFRSDLLCAKREVQAVAAGQRSEDLPACQ
jgi:acid phosphatase (class A)